MDFEFDIHFLHGTISLLICIVLLPMLLSAILSHTFAKQLQKRLVYLLLLNILWNSLAFLEQLPASYIADSTRMVIYILGVFCWIQYGYAIFCIIIDLAGNNLRPGWKTVQRFLNGWNLLGILLCLFTGFSGYFYTGITLNWYGYTAENSQFANIAILLFLVLPVALAAIIAYQSIRTNAYRIYRIVFSICATSIIAGFLLDAILPAFGLFIYAQSASIFLFIITVTLFFSIFAISKTEMDLPKILNEIVQSLEKGVLILNSNGNVELANRAALQMFGVGSKAILQKPISYFFPSILPLNEMHNIPAIIQKTNVATSVSVSPLYSNNIFIGYRIDLDDMQKSQESKQKNSILEKAFQDNLNSINARFLSLQKLNRSQSLFLQSLLDYLPIRLWSKKQIGSYSQQNKKDIQERGYKISQIDDPPFTDLEKQALQSPGKIAVRNETHIDPNGKKRWEKHICIPMFDEANRVDGILGLIEDTTDFHALEEERNQLKENLLKASNFEDMSNVAGGLAHDFNNILAVVIGYRDLAETTLPKNAETARAEQYLEKMQHSLNTATDLVKRTYEHLKARESNQEKTFTHFNVSLVFDEIEESLQATLPPNIKIIKNSSSDMTAYGNPTDFHRVMLNMGKNAILAMKDGGTLTYSCQKIDIPEKIVTAYSTIPAGSYLLISVEDTGSGMNPDVVKHIFTPYFTTRPPGEGMGIGLSVSLQLIKAANAYIDVKSIIGKGTTFKLYWPMTKTTEDEKHG